MFVDLIYRNLKLIWIYSSSCNTSSGLLMKLGQHIPSEPSGRKQNIACSNSVGSCGTIPLTSRNSAAGNQAGSESSTITIPNKRQRATPGIHKTDTPIRQQATKMHQ